MTVSPSGPSICWYPKTSRCAFPCISDAAIGELVMQHVARIEQQQELPEIGHGAHQAVFFELLQQFLFPLVVGSGNDRSELLLGFLGILHGAAVDRGDAAQLMQRPALSGKCREAVFGHDAPLLPNRFRSLLGAGADADVESSLGRLHRALEQGFLADHVRGDFAKRVRLAGSGWRPVAGCDRRRVAHHRKRRAKSTLAYLQHIGFC